MVVASLTVYIMMTLPCYILKYGSTRTPKFCVFYGFMAGLYMHDNACLVTNYIRAVNALELEICNRKRKYGALDPVCTLFKMLVIPLRMVS